MMYQTPSGKLYYFPGQLTPYEAQKRMENESRWCEEHREELRIESQQLFDDMFGG